MNTRKSIKASTDSESQDDGKALINEPMMSLFASAPPRLSQTAATAVVEEAPSPKRKASLERLQAMTQLFHQTDETQPSQPAAAPTASPRKY